MDKAADMGLLAPHVPVEYGGVGYSSVENAILTEELSPPPTPGSASASPAPASARRR